MKPEDQARQHIDDMLKRDKVSLDLFWLRDKSLEGADALAVSIVEDLQAALEQFAAIADDLIGNTNEPIRET